MCLFNSIDLDYLGRIENLHFETSKLQEGFLATTTQFLQGINVLEDPAFNTDGFISRDKYVSSISLNRSIWNKMSLFTN
jgi:hypothetical protein